MSLETLIENIGLSELINCILVQGDARNAFLIQPPDYHEISFSDPITKKKLEAINEKFPLLKQSSLEAGTLISKKTYTPEMVNSDEIMGEILGYPCSNDFQYTLNHKNNEVTYTIDVVVNFTIDSQLPSVTILNNVCKDDKKYSEFQTLANKFETILKRNKEIGFITKNVVAEKTTDTPPKLLIQKILGNIKLNENDLSALMNIIYNLGFPYIELQMYDYEFSNPIHQGILVMLISYYINNPMEAFYPLQRFPEQNEKVNSVMEEWQNHIIHLLNESRTKTKYKKNGGKRNTRRKKTSKSN